MDHFIMKPKIDFAFKEIMEDENARTGFLSAVLHLDPSSIKQTRILNPYLRKFHEGDKLGILDVRVLMGDGTQVDTEIQLSKLKVWADRALFYLAKMYTGQAGKGQKYNVLKKCVSISILDFILFEKEAGFYSCFHILEDTRHFAYTDKMEFHVIELPKLPEGLQDASSRIELWAKFINAENKEEFDMIAEKDPFIKSAYHQLQAISRDKQKRLEYEAREKAILDHNQFLFEAEQRGQKQGIEIGEKRGIEIGEKRGGKRTAVSIAVKMKAENLPDDMIAKLTGLSVSEVSSL